MSLLDGTNVAEEDGSSSPKVTLVPRINVPHFVYKASQRQFLESMQRDGSFKITRLSEFRRIEEHGSAIGDVRDGVHTLHVDQFRTGDIVPEEIRVGPILLTKQARNFFTDGCTITRAAQDNTFIFSVSTYHSSELLARYEEDSGAGGPVYDGFVRITRPLQFGMALAKALALTAASDIDWYFHPCIYSPTTSNFVEDGNVDRNVAVYKEPTYLYQAEWRFVFKIRIDPQPPFYVVQATEAANCIDRVIQMRSSCLEETH